MCAAAVFCAIAEIMIYAFCHYRLRLRPLAVLAEALKAAAVGAPFVPTLRIRSGFLPAAFWRLIRARFLWMLEYKPGFAAIRLSPQLF